MKIELNNFWIKKKKTREALLKCKVALFCSKRAPCHFDILDFSLTPHWTLLQEEFVESIVILNQHSVVVYSCALNLKIGAGGTISVDFSDLNVNGINIKKFLY